MPSSFNPTMKIRGHQEIHLFLDTSMSTWGDVLPTKQQNHGTFGGQLSGPKIIRTLWLDWNFMWCRVSATGFWLGRVRSLSIIQQKSCRLPVFTSITTCKVHLVKETASFHSGNLFKHYNKRSHFEDLLMIETVAVPCTTYIVTGCSTYILICQLSLIV